MIKKFLIAGAILLAVGGQSFGAIVISGFSANPTGTDTNNEYVQLRALQNINFATNNFSVVVANNGAATASGWAQGLNISYKFDLTSGTVNQGDTFYVGGSAQLLDGTGSTSMAGLTWIRTIAYATTAGDGFGSLNAGGVFGNGGGNADGIGVFSGIAVTATSTPIDAVFYGANVGTAFSTPNGYRTPINDVTDGTLFGSSVPNSKLFGDAATAGNFTRLTGVFDLGTSAWTTLRVSSFVTAPTLLSQIDSTIALTAVPEPTSIALIGMVGVAGLAARYRRKNVSSSVAV